MSGREWSGAALPAGSGALRSRWRAASLAAGWPFPGDWPGGAVDAVCAAVVTGAGGLVPLLADLGAARAEAGVGLAGALDDLAAFHAASAPGAPAGLDLDAVPNWMVRALALGWAEVTARHAIGREVRDPLTGLATPGYLRTRLHEVYRWARAAGRTPADEHALITVSLRVPDHGHGYPRSMGMVLVAEVLRAVFDAGETVALLRASTAAVLAPRDRTLGVRCARVRHLAERKLAADPALRVPRPDPVSVSLEALPAEPDQACAMLAALT
ncbi:hypothetical protein [Saccharopolyspora sp. CA-218241]|uniref:hypothetical protein n=1 Tax=Saccharopolyspora sp. CA-218241 TaxID=3240027 RepID=UPI003D9812A1